MFKAVVPAQAFIQENSAVKAYEYEVSTDDPTLKVELFGEGEESLGKAWMSPHLINGQAMIANLDVLYIDADGTEVNYQARTNFRGLQFQIENRTEIAGRAIYGWQTYDEDQTSYVLQYAVEAPVNAGEPPVGHYINGAFGTFYVLDLGTHESLIDTDVINEWLAFVGIESRTSSQANRHFQILFTDFSWLEALNNHQIDCDDGSQLSTQTSSLMNTSIYQKALMNPTGCSWMSDGGGANMMVNIALCGLTLASGVGAWAAVFACGPALKSIFESVKWVDDMQKEECDNNVCSARCPNGGACGWAPSPYGSVCRCLNPDSQRATSSGDPHIRSFDGLSFDFHAHGEFVLAEATAGEHFVVQARQQPWLGVCSGIAINSAVATEIGGMRIGFYANQTPALVVNGMLTELPGGYVRFEDGSFIRQLDDKTFELMWHSGEHLTVNAGDAVHIDISLPDSRRGQMQGILGTYNDDYSDDLRLRDGTTLPQPVDFFMLNGPFAESWRISAAESLFEYEEGADTESHTDRNFPYTLPGMAEIAPEVRENARQTCEGHGVTHPRILEECTLDVACTGDESMAAWHAKLGDPLAVLDVEMDAIKLSGDIRRVMAPASVEVGDLVGVDAHLFTERVGVALPLKTVVNLTEPGEYSWIYEHQNNCANHNADLLVDSYFLHYEPGKADVEIQGSVTFEEEIVGVIVVDADLDHSDAVLGNPQTTYSTLPERGVTGDTSNIITISEDRRTLTIDYRTHHRADSVTQIRILTRSVSHASGNVTPASVAQSCKAHLALGHHADGIYLIDPDGPGGDSPFPAYCDMTTDGGGWTMVLKVNSEVSGNAAQTWRCGILSESPRRNLGVERSAAHIGSRIVPKYWNTNGFAIKDVDVRLLSNGEVVKQLRFSGANTDSHNWFSLANLVSAPWTDLHTEPQNFFDIGGSEDRSFYINRNWDGCEKDNGWLIVNGTVDGCEFESFDGSPMNIMYSDSDTFENWTTGSVGRADVFGIFVR